MQAKHWLGKANSVILRVTLSRGCETPPATAAHKLKTHEGRARAVTDSQA